MVSKRAAQQSASLHYTWQSRQKEWLADQLIFLDESASNKRTSNKKQSWAPISTDCEVSTPYKRSERWSILPVLTLKSYIDHIIFQGVFTSELFKAFIEHKVLPNYIPYPGPRLIIILDNASVYKSKQL